MQAAHGHIGKKQVGQRHEAGKGREEEEYIETLTERTVQRLEGGLRRRRWKVASEPEQ